jgi:4-hydroxy-4-methyl-2-oxoglutarate aldolase
MKGWAKRGAPTYDWRCKTSTAMRPLNGDIPSDTLERLRQFDTCTLSNAIERLNLRPRNEGFVRGVISCRFPKLPPVIGRAVTARMRSSVTPVKGRCYYEHPEFWKYVGGFRGPQILVIQDGDDLPGVGALVGEAYARISRALGCVACVTDGAARDLTGIEALNYQVYSGSIAVSHAYAHVVDFGGPVQIGGLTIHSGDLLHGDLHGVHQIPHEAVGSLAVVAEQVLREDRELFELTDRKDFSVATLTARLEGVNKHLL